MPNQLGEFGTVGYMYILPGDAVLRYILSPQFFIRVIDQDILSPKSSSYMRPQSSCPVGCVALYPTAVDFRKGKNAWHCAMIR